MRRIALIAVLGAVLLGTSGCELFRILGLPWGNKVPYNPSAAYVNTTIRRNIQFLDVPVPMGFLLRRERMFSYECATFRLGSFEYDGAWPYRKTKTFYDRQMPAHGWEVLSEKIGDMQAVQYWAKGGDRARILYDNAGPTIKVFVRISPVGNEPAPIELR